MQRRPNASSGRRSNSTSAGNALRRLAEIVWHLPEYGAKAFALGCLMFIIGAVCFVVFKVYPLLLVFPVGAVLLYIAGAVVDRVGGRGSVTTDPAPVDTDPEDHEVEPIDFTEETDDGR
jgi:hypothetical protein